MKSLVQMDSNQRSSTNCKRQVNRGVLDLPHEMISEILCRLPTESILICRVVCKTWYAITKDPCFINTLGNSHYQPTRLILKPLPYEDIGRTPYYLVLVDMEKHKTRRIPLEKMFQELQITCSCNGFLCMAPPKKLDPVVIYNPITGDRLILPLSNSKSKVSCQVVGLGFDASTNKYKVVRAYTGLSSRRKVRRFEIISLGESSWRELSAPQRIVNRDSSGVTFLSGALYWTMSKGTSTIVVQFDLTDEKFRVISFPRYFSSRHVSLGLIDIRGIVTLVQGDSNTVRLWRIGDGEGEDELSFYFYISYDTHVKWGGGFSCAFLRQINQESYLLQVGYWNSQNERLEHLTQYFPDKVQFLDLKLRGLPDSFKTVCFKPSLVPLPK
ncbi:F-box protein At3g07870-like [Rhododendron vialii]|uniref:F-box protein At3g07870-like n=1 Tax=Rhododendron vialii TaxID=182163 RepID=UPI00265F458A|nr:F-box protein At3g07870-like [Rhododendron vialii]XP_058195355.1 F-box protein At3g07870-like [Rhododendron vialii]